MKFSRLLLLLSFFTYLSACDSGSDNGPVVQKTQNVSGIYNTYENQGEIPSITSVKIVNGKSESELQILALRNGLSFSEREFYSQHGITRKADSLFGRELILKHQKNSDTPKNILEDEVSKINACDQKTSFPDESIEIRNCIKMNIPKDQSKLSGTLVVEIYRYGDLEKELEIDFKVFNQKRWFLDYFGNWRGELYIHSSGFSYATGENIVLTFQPVSESQYILRPYDINQRLSFKGEDYALHPVTRQMSELEGNASPYINFEYVSEVNGQNKVIKFQSYVRSDKKIEGTILFYKNQAFQERIGYYELTQD